MQRGTYRRRPAQQVRQHGTLGLGVTHRAAGPVFEDGRVPLVHPDLRAGPVQRSGQTRVVRVAVGQEYGAYVPQGTARPGQVVVELAKVAGQSGVDEGETVRVLYQVEVDDVVAQAVDTGSDLSAGLLARSFIGHGSSKRSTLVACATHGLRCGLDFKLG